MKMDITDLGLINWNQFFFLESIQVIFLDIVIHELGFNIRLKLLQESISRNLTGPKTGNFHLLAEALHTGIKIRFKGLPRNIQIHFPGEFIYIF